MRTGLQDVIMRYQKTRETENARSLSAHFVPKPFTPFSVVIDVYCERIHYKSTYGEPGSKRAAEQKKVSNTTGMRQMSLLWKGYLPAGTEKHRR